MSNFEHRITEDSTEFEKAFLKIYDGNLWTALDKMKDWKPPKQLVVVPQIVADFIVVRKGELKLYDAFKEIEECYGGELYDWVFKYSCGDLLFARAWNDGYTVEKEKMYTLKHIDLSEQYKNESVYLSHSRYAKLKHENFLKDDDMSKIER